MDKTTGSNIRLQNSASWPKVRFGDVVRNVNESVRDPQTCGLERYVGLEHIDPESLHIQRWGLIAEGTTFTRRFRKGQVLFGKRRAYQRKVAVAEFDGLCSSDILVFEPKDERLLPELLPFICQTESFFDHALDTSAGSLSPRTKYKELAQYEFLLPPLEEQRRIAEILWAIDGTENYYQKAKLSLEKLEISVIDKWIFDLLLSGEIPKLELEKVFNKSPESGFSPVPATRDTGVYVLALSALTRTGYATGFYKPVDLSAKVADTRLRKGDLLISRSNTIDLVGLIGIFSEDMDNISFPDTMMRLSINENMLTKKFLETYLLSTTGRQAIKRIAAGTSDSMKKINRIGLGKIILPIPPIEEQYVLERRQSQFEETRRDLSKTIGSIVNLKKNMLGQYLTGD